MNFLDSIAQPFFFKQIWWQEDLLGKDMNYKFVISYYRTSIVMGKQLSLISRGVARKRSFLYKFFGGFGDKSGRRKVCNGSFTHLQNVPEE